MRAILTYHSIDPSGSTISIGVATFRRQMRWLSDSSVRVLSIADLLEDEGDDAVALTFDDGFANFGDTAVPILADHGFAATLFVVTQRVGKTNAWGGGFEDVPVLPLLDWTGIARAVDQGIEVGAHGRTHRPLTSLAPSEVEAEIGGAAEDITRELGKSPRAFAYPYSALNHGKAVDVAASYSLACTSEFRSLAHSDDVYRLPRLEMYYFRKPGRLEAWGTPRFDRYLKVRQMGRAVRESIRRAVT